MSRKSNFILLSSPSLLARGFSSGGCLRCCAYEKASCEDDDKNTYKTEEFTGLAYWAIAVIIAIGVCFFFTVIYILTGRRGLSRHRRLTRYFVSDTYYLYLPVASFPKEDDSDDMSSGKKGSISDLQESLDEATADEPLIETQKSSEAISGSNNSSLDELPVARRTIAPVPGIRRPPAIAYAQAHLFANDNRPPQQLPR